MREEVRCLVCSCLVPLFCGYARAAWIIAVDYGIKGIVSGVADRHTREEHAGRDGVPGS